MSLKGGVERESQQVVSLGGERYTVAGEDQLSQIGGGARSWSVTEEDDQDDAAQAPFSLHLGSFDQGAGFSFATTAGVYEYSDGWDASAPNKPGTWNRRCTLQAMPTTVDYPGWIIPVSTYVYVMRGRYCCKYAIDDTEGAEWPIIETHDFGSGVIVTGRPAVFKGQLYVPLRTGVGGVLARWHMLSSIVATSVEQQTVAISSATGGTFTLTLSGQTTGAITAAAASSTLAAAAVQTALRALAGLERVTVTASGTSPNWTYTVTFTGVGSALTASSIAQMTSSSSLTGGGAAIAHNTTVAGGTDTWRQGSANTQASAFIVNGTKLWRSNANTLSATQAVSNPSIDGDWGATTEVGESGRDITDLGVYEGDLLVFKTDGLYRFTNDLQAVPELPDLAAVLDNRNGVGMENSLGYELMPHKLGLIRWRPGAYQFVGPEQEGSLEGGTSLGWGRVASLAPYGKQLFFTANEPYDAVGSIGSFLPATGGRGPLIPHIHKVGTAGDGTEAYYEAARVVTSTTQSPAPQTPATWSDDNAVGTIAWSDTSNASALDGSYATAAAGTTHYLKGLAPPVNVPADAVPTGILLEVAKKAGGSVAPTGAANSGTVSSIEVSYDNARSGANLTLTSPMKAGQQLLGGTTDVIYEAFGEWDTSTIPDTATIISAQLSITGMTGSTGTWTLEARVRDYGTLATADWVAGASLSGLTRVGTLPIVPGQTTGTFIEDGSNFTSAINKTGNTRLLFCSAYTVAGTPSTNEDTTSWPITNATLIVTYTSSTVDNIVKLVIAGSVTGSNLGDAVTNWPTAVSYVSYGGATNLWGTTPTVAQLNAADFGFVISATVATADTASIDHARITIYYTLGGISDSATFLIVMRTDSSKTLASGIAYKLPRANLPVVNDPNITRAISDAHFYTSRYAQPSRNAQKTYSEVELWLDAFPETNTPGFEVWATVDDGTAFQLRDETGSVATVYTTGAHRFFFPATAAAVGHYCQLEMRVPEATVGEVGLTASFRDATVRGLVDLETTATIHAALILDGSHFLDRTDVQRTVPRQREDLIALRAPSSSPVEVQDIHGDTFYAKVTGLTIREVLFKGNEQPTDVAIITLRRIRYA